MSICIANYNYGSFLQDLLPVLLRQTFLDFEIVVSDNCSTDESVAIVKRFDDPRIRLFRNEVNVGMVGNWERALSKARGRIVWMLNSDDTVEDDAFLQKVVDAMRDQGAQAACVGSTFEFVAQKRRRDNVLFKPGVRVLTHHEALYTQILYRTGPVAGQFFFTNQPPFHYDLKMKNIADYDLFTRYLIQYRPRLALVPECRLVCRFHDQNAGVSFFQNKWRDYMGELLDIIPANLREQAADRAEGERAASDLRCSLFWVHAAFILFQKHSLSDLRFLLTKYHWRDLPNLLKWGVLVPTAYLLKKVAGIYL